ncbi:MAG TPA: dTDP-4-dehydrorhamnose reductase, partial [Sinorhizobium sp.]|nr:dTDP-4-dehydrorhamnose reductase [Sinorhizobium sp.]
MRIVVTGCKGQLALSLAERALGRTDLEVVTLGRPELDLARPQTILPAIALCRPSLVVSAAAYTAVDQAEDDRDMAFAVNAVGAGAVAEAGARLGVPVIHISTDYVFDGTRQGDHAEDDAPAPLSVYGASKLAGEKAVAAANPRHLILRTGWVYSPFGKNFVKTMLQLAMDRDEIAVVADQWGNPSSALDIADAVLDASIALIQSRQGPVPGIYHLAGTGTVSRADLARHVLSV